ncbi:membrane protein insertion efficiency factor YidD [Candidatus Uhrbacteria bacterium]|nr:membrane protein insertion efficiency factor YidD [Candidatus Uhrbacteria bacterium]
MSLRVFFKEIVLFTIRIYQKTISFDHGFVRYFYPDGFCRFNPTCSDYGYQAIDQYGVLRGGLMALKRILRCNPFSKGGNDPVL